MKNRKSAKYRDRIRVLVKVGLRLLLLLLFSGVCIHYLHTNFPFKLKTLVISGNNVLSDEEIIEISRLHSGEDMFNLDAKQIQHDLESLPWIKAALVSRIFPNTVKVEVQERVPLVMIKAGELYGLDEESVALPLVSEKLLFNIPVLSGFITDSTVINPGFVVRDENIQTAVGWVLFLYLSHPDLYQQLSEINRDSDGTLTLFAVDGGTTIYLGSTDILKKFEILARFRSEIHGKRDFRDYSYLDLRWRSQIVAKERI